MIVKPNLQLLLSPVYSPFTDRVGIPLHSIPSPGMLIISICSNKQHCTTHGLTLDPKLTYSTHIHNISVQAHKPLQMIKALTETGWGKQKETLMASLPIRQL